MVKRGGGGSYNFTEDPATPGAAPPTAPGLTEFVKRPADLQPPTTNMMDFNPRFNAGLSQLNFRALPPPPRRHLRDVGRGIGFRGPRFFASAPPQTQGGRKTYKNKSKKHRKSTRRHRGK